LNTGVSTYTDHTIRNGLDFDELIPVFEKERVIRVTTSEYNPLCTPPPVSCIPCIDCNDEYFEKNWPPIVLGKTTPPTTPEQVVSVKVMDTVSVHSSDTTYAPSDTSGASEKGDGGEDKVSHSISPESWRVGDSSNFFPGSVDHNPLKDSIRRVPIQPPPSYYMHTHHSNVPVPYPVVQQSPQQPHGITLCHSFLNTLLMDSHRIRHEVECFSECIRDMKRELEEVIRYTSSFNYRSNGSNVMY
jgi:hypothetical protein